MRLGRSLHASNHPTGHWKENACRSNHSVPGAAHEAGSQLASQVLQTPQGQEAVARTAKEIACGSAALIGSVGVAGTAIAAVAVPVALAGAAGYGLLWVAAKISEVLEG